MKTLVMLSMLVASSSCLADGDLAKGKASFATNCVICHGENGDGNGPAGMAMNPKPRDFTQGKFKAGAEVDQIYKTITSGLPGTSMPGFGQLPDDERKALATYVKSFIKK